MASGRPLGVTIFGSLNRLFFGALGLLMWLFGFFQTMSPEGRQEILAKTPGLSGSLLDLFLVYAIVQSALTMVAGHWVLKGQERGRLGTLVLAVCTIVGLLAWNLSQLTSSQTLGSLLYHVAVLWYFTQPHVKAWFRQTEVRPL